LTGLAVSGFGVRATGALVGSLAVTAGAVAWVVDRRSERAITDPSHLPDLGLSPRP
jgi:hypothetical protein